MLFDAILADSSATANVTPLPQALTMLCLISLEYNLSILP
jgi:hypothetical protein